MRADAVPMTVTGFFTRLGELVIDGRLAEATGFWTFPCPIEVEGELTVMRDPCAMRQLLLQRRSAALAAGVVRMVPSVHAIEVPRDGRFRVWLRWVMSFEDRNRTESLPSIYYMARRPSGDLVIEMMDIVRMPDASAAAPAPALD